MCVNVGKCCVIVSIAPTSRVPFKYRDSNISNNISNISDYSVTLEITVIYVLKSSSVAPFSKFYNRNLNDLHSL